jgi:hypothetical protein
MRFTGTTALGVPKELPVKYGNISGFNLLPDDRLKEEGWMPLVTVEPPEYDPDEQYRSLEYVVNENDITPTYTITDFLDVGRVGEWCSVEDGEITGGPFACPKVWDGVQMYLLTEAEINAMSWYKYVAIEPEYNEDTQYLTHVDEIALPVVNAIYTVNDYPTEDMANKISDKQAKKLAELYDNVKQFISYQSNGWPRYDVDLKLNMMNAAMAAMAAGGSEPVKVKQAKDWIMAVQQAFFGVKTAIATATTLADVRAIDASYEWFESQYGRDGVVEADPAISTDDLFE